VNISLIESFFQTQNWPCRKLVILLWMDYSVFLSNSIKKEWTFLIKQLSTTINLNLIFQHEKKSGVREKRKGETPIRWGWGCHWLVELKIRYSPPCYRGNNFANGKNSQMKKKRASIFGSFPLQVRSKYVDYSTGMYVFHIWKDMYHRSDQITINLSYLLR